MHRKLVVLAAAVVMSTLPIQPAHAVTSSCEAIGLAGIFRLDDGTEAKRSWRLIAEGAVYESEKLDKMIEDTSSSSSSSSKKKKKKNESTRSLEFKDEKTITRTANDGELQHIVASMEGIIRPEKRSASITLIDTTNGKTYKIDDPEKGPKITC